MSLRGTDDLLYHYIVGRLGLGHTFCRQPDDTEPTASAVAGANALLRRNVNPALQPGRLAWAVGNSSILVQSILGLAARAKWSCIL